METGGKVVRLLGCRAGIPCLPVVVASSRESFFVGFIVSNFGQDARKTGRLEACPTFLRREHSPFCLTQNGGGFAEEFERIQPARTA